MQPVLSSLAFWGILLGPLLLFGYLIHLCEHVLQTRLATRFGWRSVLFTGWLGTPIHELSHAVACWLFRHRIEELQLFDPDPQDGRLGYVRHSYRRGNWFEESGNVVIGTAPLLGGSLVLMLLTWVFYPDVLRQAMLAVSGLQQTTATDWRSFTAAVWQPLGHLLQPERIGTLRFWIYAWLVICVAAHMAPSRSDYAGATRSAVWLAIIGLVGSLLVFGWWRIQPWPLVYEMLQIFLPLYAIALFALGIVALATGIVTVVTQFFPVRYRIEHF